MVRHGTSRCAAKLVTSGGTILRKKGKRTNSYTLDGGEPFSAVRSDVPEAVRKAFPVSEVNFQMQEDGWFWISETAGKVSREMNRVVDLEVIDRSIASILSEVKEAEAEVRFCAKRLEEAKGELASLEWVPAYAADVERLSRQEQELLNKRDRALRLHTLVAAASRLRKEGQTLSRVSDAAANAVASGRAVLALQERRNRLATALQRAQDALKRSQVPLPDVGPLQRAAFALATKEAKRERLRKAIQRAEALEGERCRAEATCTRVADTLDRESGGVCPLCGGVMRNPARSRP
jgi:hypothetical protein